MQPADTASESSDATAVVAVVADVGAGGWWAVACNRVLVELLEARLVGTTVTTYSCSAPDQLVVRGEGWRSLAQLAVEPPDVVVALGAAAADAVAGVPLAVPTVRGPAIGAGFDPACAYPALVDAAALDVRSRMLSHLGIMHPGDVLDDQLLDAVSRRFPINVGDVVALVRLASRVTASDAATIAFAAGRRLDNIAVQIDTVATAVRSALDERSAASASPHLASAELRRRITILERDHTAELMRLLDEVDARQRALDGVRGSQT